MWLLLLLLLVLVVLVLSRRPSTRQIQPFRYDTELQTYPTRKNYIALATVAADIYNLAIPNTTPTASRVETWSLEHGLIQSQVLYTTESIVTAIGIKSQPLGLIAKIADDPTTGLIVFRGSQTAVDWINNVNFVQTDLSMAGKDFPSGVGITTGYAKLYSNGLATQTVNGCSCTSQCTSILGKSMCLTQNQCGQSILGRYYDTCVVGSGRSLGDSVKAWVLDHPEVSNYILTGHSLGGAPTTLAALQLRLLGKNVNAVYTFASPRIGSPQFATLYNSYVGSQTFRFTAINDPVPSLPLPITPIPNNCFQHVGRVYPVEWWPPNTVCNPKAIAVLQHRAVIDPQLFDFVAQQLGLQ